MTIQTHTHTHSNAYVYICICMYVYTGSVYIERHGFAYIARAGLSLTVCPGWLGTCDPPVLASLLQLGWQTWATIPAAGNKLDEAPASVAPIAIGWVELPCSQVNKEYSGVVSGGVRKTKHIGTGKRNRTGGDRGGTLRKAPLEGRLGERRTNLGESTEGRRSLPNRCPLFGN